jgi:hypothetical protein
VPSSPSWGCVGAEIASSGYDFGGPSSTAMMAGARYRGVQNDGRHGIASAHSICPSKPRKTVRPRAAKRGSQHAPAKFSAACWALEASAPVEISAALVAGDGVVHRSGVDRAWAVYRPATLTLSLRP